MRAPLAERYRSLASRLAGSLSLTPLHPAEELSLSQIDPVPALASQIVDVAAEADVHHELSAHLLHEIDGWNEVAVF
jgi:hypothetical protein